MIGFLRGAYISKTPTQVLVDVQGVGYEVNISLNTFEKIQSLTEGTLITHLIVREDAHILYGFFDRAEKDMFIMLTSVSGVGASTARIMLSSMKPGDVYDCIIRGDVKSLERVKGIGKKTAERLVLELKDKAAKLSMETSNNYALQGNTLRHDALIALAALGINRQVAEKAVDQSLMDNEEATVEDLIKRALKSI